MTHVPVVLTRWVLSPVSTRQYPPGSIAYLVFQSWPPVVIHDHALLEVEYTEVSSYSSWCTLREQVEVPRSAFESLFSSNTSARHADR